MTRTVPRSISMETRAVRVKVIRPEKRVRPYSKCVRPYQKRDRQNRCELMTECKILRCRQNLDRTGSDRGGSRTGLRIGSQKKK